MTIIDNEMLWRQFGAAIDMFGDALRDCPDALSLGDALQDCPQVRVRVRLTHSTDRAAMERAVCRAFVVGGGPIVIWQLWRTLMTIHVST